MFDGFLAEFLAQYGTQIIYAALTAVIGAIGLAAKRIAKKIFDSKEKRRIAKEVVLFVEQVYKNCGGEEKLAQALAAAEEMLAEAGVTFNELEMRVLIERQVAEMNDVFAGDDDDSEADEPSEPAE